ncbi:MAG: response regulator [Chlorobiaceae bacterium]|nr:response regulator [Chlorobiaceae bacterium]
MPDKTGITCQYNRMHAFFDGSAEPMFIIDAAGTIIETNPTGKSFCAGYGVKGPGTNVFDFMEAHPTMGAVGSSRRAILQQVLSTKKSVVFTDTHNSIANQIGAYPILSPNGEVIELFIILRDITQQHQNEQEICDLQTQWDITSESCHIGLWKIDLMTNTAVGNAEQARIFGYEPDADVSWTRERLLEHIVPEDRPGIETLIRSSINTQSNYYYKCRIRRTDGERRWIYVMSSCQFDANGKATHYVGTTQDITEFNELKRINEELQEQLVQAQKLELLGQLAGGIAHDFNNVLTSIQGSTELIMKDISPTNPHYQNLVTITHSVDRSAEMVKHLLAFARKQPRCPIDIEIDAELDRMYLLLRKLLRENIFLRWELNCPNLLVKIDPANLVQIVTNLCVNARDAIDGYGQGHITLNTTTVNAHNCEELQHVSVNPPGDYLRIRISDNGSGIPPDIYPHIFEPFFTTKGVGKGTGMGLSTVYGLVRQNDGHITCETAMGKGTTFNIFFPIVQKSPDADDSPIPMDQPAAPDKTVVLVVEDEPHIAKIIKTVLEQAGFVALGANNAEDALEIARQQTEKIELTISDILLPCMNGVLMSKELVKHNPAMKFLFISGYSTETLGEYGKVSEETNFISKPFSIIRFLNKVHTILEHNQQQLP